MSSYDWSINKVVILIIIKSQIISKYEWIGYE